MNRQQFLEYADHFNNHRWDKVVSYFCPDVTVEYPDNFMGPQIPGVTGNTLHGPCTLLKPCVLVSTRLCYVGGDSVAIVADSRSAYSAEEPAGGLDTSDENLLILVERVSWPELNPNLSNHPGSPLPGKEKPGEIGQWGAAKPVRTYGAGPDLDHFSGGQDYLQAIGAIVVRSHGVEITTKSIQ